jgi:hypothetical protein
MKLALRASGGVLPPHSHYKQSHYSRFLRLVVAYGDGYSVPPIPGALQGVNKGSGERSRRGQVRDLQGVYEGSTRGLQGVYKGSTRGQVKGL